MVPQDERFLRTLFTELTESPPASLASVKQAERTLQQSFPDDYRDFLAWSDGISGWLACGAYIELYPVLDVAMDEVNTDIRRWMPGTVIIGTSGGGMALAIAFQAQYAEYVWFPFDNVVSREVRRLGRTIGEAIKSLSESAEWCNIEPL